MILDGTSQARYGVPHFDQPTKTTSTAHKQSTHFVAAIVHGLGAWLYGLGDEWAHDSNLTIEVLQRTLSNVELRGNDLPPILDLQMDNCWRENKNRSVCHSPSYRFELTVSRGSFVLAWLCLLVHRGVFQEVNVNFLLVGHTHEDIDALFGVISKYISGRNALSLQELGTLMAQATNDPVMRFEHIKAVRES